jgi:hypothetical protein
MKRLSRGFRRALLKAGATRAELHVVDCETPKAITSHDLRSTGLTWLAVRGDVPQRIQQRAGHQNFSTTQVYIRLAAELSAGFGEPFPTLPETLFREHYRKQPSAKESAMRNYSGSERGGRDLNPRPPA